MQWHSPSSLLRNLIRSQVFGIVVTCSNQNQFSESVLLLNVNCCLEVWGWEVKTKLICSAELPAWCHLWLPALFRNHFSTSCDDRVVVLCSILYVSASLQGRIMFADLLAVEGMKNLIMWSCNFRWVLCSSVPLPTEVTSQGRFYSEGRRPRTGAETTLNVGSGWNGRQWEGVVLLWYPLGYLQLSRRAKIFHSSTFLFKMSLWQFSGESTQSRLLAGATHSIMQQRQLFELSPAELW